MIQCALWAAFPGMLAENRVIAISPSCQLYFNWPPLTFGKTRSNRSHQPALFVYTSVWLPDLASPPALLTLQHTRAPWNYSGREEQGKAWNDLVLWAEQAGALPAAWPAKRAVPKSAACCVFWQAAVRYRRYGVLAKAALWAVSGKWDPAPASPSPPAPAPIYMFS